MRISSKFVCALGIGAIGAIAAFTANTVGAQQPGPNNWHIEKINKADDAYFKAVIALETAGETPARLKALQQADDRYFEAVMAFEAAEREAVQIAKVEAADDAYFKAAMELEQSRRQAVRLAELKTERQLIAQAEADDKITTASLPGGGVANEIASNLSKVKAADDAYFDAVIALETSGENPEDLKRLKDADDAYFSAVIALEDAYAKEAEAKKAGKPVKVAAATPAPMVQMQAVKAPMPAPAVSHAAKPRTYAKPVRTASTGYRVVQQPQQGPGLFGMMYNIVTFPIRTVLGSPQQGQ